MRALLCACVVALSATASQAEQPVQVMILGTYHFGNPGQDIHNVQVDDVLTPQRQAQIAQVLNGLARFKPNRVAVEVRADGEPTHTVPAYRQFRGGLAPARRNEIDQIGYRLAQQLGHADVHGIDVDGEFPFEAVQAFGAKSGRGTELQAMLDALGANTKAFEARQRHATIGQLLRELNTRANVQRDHAFYMRLLAWGEGTEQPGARLVASWSARNLGICARLAQVAKPGDRIVVVYGSGHAFALRDCVQQVLKLNAA